MREFTKHVITALKEDEWLIKPRAIKHVKSFLVIDTDNMQPYEAPIKFTWWERRVVKYHVNKLRDRMLVAKFIECRLNPRKLSSYSVENNFLND